MRKFNEIDSSEWSRLFDALSKMDAQGEPL
jgi:hypothetical protein